jgi:uncharacterized protein YjiS (DUF1127 family)
MSSERLSLERFDRAPAQFGLGRRILEIMKQWRTRARQRDTLARMSPLQLRDIGLSETDVWRETRRPPWIA